MRDDNFSLCFYIWCINFFRYSTPTCPCQISLELLLEHRAIKFVWNIVHESDLLIVIHFFAFFWSETIEFACDPSVQITSHEHHIPNHSSYNNGSHLTMAFLHSHSLTHTFIQKNTAFPYMYSVWGFSSVSQRPCLQYWSFQHSVATESSIWLNIISYSDHLNFTASYNNMNIKWKRGGRESQNMWHTFIDPYMYTRQ